MEDTRQIHTHSHTILVHSLPEPSTPPLSKTGPVTGWDIPSVVVSIGFLLVWAVTLIVTLGIPKAARDKKIYWRSPSQVPCRQCQFFSVNPYLRCAIHPLTALTSEAVDCSDYQPTQEIKQPPA